MTYNSLTNKFRPKNLKDFIGQDQAIFIIKNLIKNKNIHQSYIISGPSGVGKTSLAKLLIKCINCEIKITYTPCGICQTCISIDKNKNIESIEIDVASNTKVDDIKEFIDVAKYKNSKNRYRTFILDECHMLSQNSFNYLLKILEEPYKNTIYILITTQIEKIPKTIISRCIEIQLNNLTKNKIKEFLKNLLKKEEITIDLTSLDYISIFSGGNLRHALNITEKITTKDKTITKDITRYILGILPELTILFIIKNIKEKDIKNLISNVKKITNNNLNYKNILIQIQITLYKLLLSKINIIYDKEINKYIIFKYLTKKLKILELNNMYIKLMEINSENIKIYDIDFEIILINLSINN